MTPRPLRFMFATGIECSNPIIRLPDGRTKRVDQMESCGHYARWREDFRLVKEIGADHLRYGPPCHTTHRGPGRYDWSFADETFGDLRELGINPIADLCHFGVPDWVGDFQNPDWPELFAEYAGEFAERYPWVTLYTPVNEIFITALFSAELGWWNERLSSGRGFVTALKHLAKANLLAEAAILRRIPEARFIQSESTEYFHASEPAALAQADFLNQKRFLSLDLCYGHDVRACMYEYLLDHGMTREEYHWFMRNGSAVKPACVMGNDYYSSTEHLVRRRQNGLAPSGEIFGYYVITKQYFDRYNLPVMHTETNMSDVAEAGRWLWKEWVNVLRLRQDGVPIVGFTWYSLTDQMDWDTALREDNGRVTEVGLYDLDRRMRPVGRQYRKLIAQWRPILRGVPIGDAAMARLMVSGPDGELDETPDVFSPDGCGVAGEGAPARVSAQAAADK